MAAPKKPKASRTKKSYNSKAAKPVKKIDKRGAPKGPGHRGNVKFVATEEQRIKVEAFVTVGAQQWLIAEELGVSEDTLQRHFRPQLNAGKERALSRIGSSMVSKALSGDSDAAKFVLARIGGWKAGLEHSGPGGAPIEYRNLSDEELDARIAAHMAGNASPAAKA